MIKKNFWKGRRIKFIVFYFIISFLKLFISKGNKLFISILVSHLDSLDSLNTSRIFGFSSSKKGTSKLKPVAASVLNLSHSGCKISGGYSVKSCVVKIGRLILLFYHFICHRCWYSRKFSLKNVQVQISLNSLKFGVFWKYLPFSLWKIKKEAIKKMEGFCHNTLISRHEIIYHISISLIHEFPFYSFPKYCGHSQ